MRNELARSKVTTRDQTSVGHLPLASFDRNLLKLPDTTQPKAPSH